MTEVENSGATRGRFEGGQVVIIVVLTLALGAGFLVYSLATPRFIAAQRDAQTNAAFANVKQALIGWSASRTPVLASPTIRPGELPCPDMDNDGLDNDGPCLAGDIGRVPWKTLGIPEPRDGNGETLWYAIAGPFRYKPQSSQPITSDTLGNLTVYLNSSAIVQTSQAIAVLFSPGPALGTQSRGSMAALCSTTGTTISQGNCATNYLESTGGGNNAQIGGPFIQAAVSSTFNDRILAITNADLMPLVEQRVAREMMSLLKRYKVATGVYPWADLADGNSNGTPFSNAYNRARFPCGTALPSGWGSGGTPSLPDWLTNGCASVSGWAGLVYYAVAKNQLEASGSGCTTCTGSTLDWTNTGLAYLCPFASVPFSCTLTNIPIGSGDVILITPGASDGSPRNWPTSFSPITGYFEDTDNSDNNDDQYAIPTASNDSNRDRMFIMR